MFPLSSLLGLQSEAAGEDEFHGVKIELDAEVIVAWGPRGMAARASPSAR